MKGLNIYGKVCSVIPSGFGKFFSGIIALALTETSMKTISSEDLKQFPSLEEFWLYNQLVEYIEPQLFKHNRDLKHLVLYNNKIKYIGSNFFNELPKLSVVALDNNKCKITGSAKNAAELEKIIENSKLPCDGKILTSNTVFRI